MADYKQQQQDHRAGRQHLANRQQEASATPAVLVHQQQQVLDHNRLAEALVAVQDLERQRLGQLTQHQAGEQLQSQQHQQS